jgi:hypothetical protein
METTQLGKEEKMCFEPFIGGLIGYGTGGAEGAREGRKAGSWQQRGRYHLGLGQDLGSE